MAADAGLRVLLELGVAREKEALKGSAAFAGEHGGVRRSDRRLGDGVGRGGVKRSSWKLGVLGG